MAESAGRQCHICTGCGRCAGGAEASLHVVTESFLKPSEKKNSGRTFCVVDIGTTTIAMELYDAVGKKAEYVCANPQRIFGADVISRIQAAENPMNARQMRAQIVFTLSDGLKSFGEKAREVKAVYVAGNTTMLYLLMGHDTQPLGYAPFCADFLQGETFSIGTTEIITLPGLSAFVGADVFAGILACGMQKSEEISLLIDLGTNGELVLGNRKKMLACSTAAGPVFDNLCNKAGETVWGADVVHLAAKLLEKGLVDETGLLTEPYFESGIDIGGVHITQESIRNLQTAKAAIATGVEYLLQEYGIEARQVKKVYLAGGFGHFLQEADAIRIGLLAKEFAGRVVAVGNTALAGAYVYEGMEEREKVTERIMAGLQPLNLAQWKDFGESFIQNMDFGK